MDALTGLPTGTPLRIDWKAEGYPSYAVVAEGLDGRVWLACNSNSQALIRIEKNNTEVILESWDDLLDSKIEYLFEKPNGDLWIVARGELLIYSDGKWIKRNPNRYYSDIPFARELSNGRFLLGGRNDSVHQIDLSENQWKTYPDLNFQCQDVSGAWWFLSRDKRIVRHYPQSNSWQSYGVEDGLIDKPNAVLATQDGVVWVSGSHGDDAAVSWLMEGRWHRHLHPEFSRMISHSAVLEGNDGYVYFGSNMEAKDALGRLAGLLRYKNLGDSVEFRYLSPPDAPQRITSIGQTQDGTLWFCGRNLSFKRPEAPVEIVDSFNDEWPVSLCIDAEDGVWVGNWRSGLYKKEATGWEKMSEGGKRSKFGVVNLLSGNRLPGIWAATIDGIHRFDGQSWSYGALLPELQIQRRATRLLESSDGALWINLSSRDWNYNIDPEFAESDASFKVIRYFPDLNPPETVLNDFDDRVPESGTMHISWSGADPWSLTPNSQLEFSYRLNQGDWSPFSNRAEAVLHSMPAGNFTMEVRARDADWNMDPTPAVAQFSVVPFLWKQPWFLTAVCLTLALIIGLIVLIVRMRIRHMLALEQFKIDFFTRISHELRTPLSVILGPLQSLLATASINQKEPLEMAYRNARRMQGLVDTLLEFRKVELGKLSYDPVRSDLHYFIKDLFHSHSVLWQEKGQDCRLEVSRPSGELCFDPQKLQHIFSNLLSNAIKYTPKGGTILVLASLEETGSSVAKLILEVSDSGIGISTEDQKRIFDPFYRERRVRQRSDGSGIGLAYTYELVSLWGGRISVESPFDLGQGPKGGARFRVELPLVDDESAPVVSVDETLSAVETEREITESINEALEDTKKPTILIVEDNADVRTFLTAELKDRYDILVAPNGKRGLKQAQEAMPELIISDLMMPEMDGLELCRQLKSNQETSHIPVLLLTAKGSDEFRLKGIQIGADDYFAKPVNVAILKARIVNLLESRQRLRDLFTRQIVVQPKEVTVTSSDEEFLRKAICIVEDHMRDETFGVEDLAVKVGMGRTSLYRKMKAVTGLSPHEFIKSMRLKRAAQLLSTGEMNVSETYEEVGISTISYFSKIFREAYGCTPSEYRQQAVNSSASAQ